MTKATTTATTSNKQRACFDSLLVRNVQRRQQSSHSGMLLRPLFLQKQSSECNHHGIMRRIASFLVLPILFLLPQLAFLRLCLLLRSQYEGLPLLLLLLAVARVLAVVVPIRTRRNGFPCRIRIWN